MIKTIKIGFQGDIGSNSEEASRKFTQELNIENAVYIPLITSQNVVDALENKKIDFGVMAITNNSAGIVIETQKALTKKIKLLKTTDLHIHHSLFTKNKNDQIKFVASHIQALNQTKSTRQKLIPNAIEIECTDTAHAAKMLAEGKYPNTYAVICRKNAGLNHNLFLLAQNIEDNPENKTTFGLFKLKN